MFNEFFVLFTIIRLQEKRKKSGRNGKTSSCSPRLGSKPRCSNLSSFLERTVLPCKSGDPKLNKPAYKSSCQPQYQISPGEGVQYLEHSTLSMSLHCCGCSEAQQQLLRGSSTVGIFRCTCLCFLSRNCLFRGGLCASWFSERRHELTCCVDHLVTA